MGFQTNMKTHNSNFFVDNWFSIGIKSNDEWRVMVKPYRPSEVMGEAIIQLGGTTNEQLP